MLLLPRWTACCSAAHRGVAMRKRRCMAFRLTFGGPALSDVFSQSFVPCFLEFAVVLEGDDIGKVSIADDTQCQGPCSICEFRKLPFCVT